MLCQYSSMIRKCLIAFVWYPSALLVFIALLLNLLLRDQQTQIIPTATSRQESAITGFGIMNRTNVAAGGDTAKVLSATIIADDARPYLIEQFLQKHNSPMAPYARDIVTYADVYGLDYRLTTAIAGCESNWGKRMPLKDAYNAHGISVYTGTNQGATFNGWKEEIAWVSRYIKEKYYDRGIWDLEEIGKIYAPPSAQNGNSWAKCVSSFINKII